MKKLFIVLISLTSTLLFSQNVDTEKLNQLSNTISENGCNCVQQIKISNGDWINSIENCFVESFKKNEQKVKQLLGANYLDEENGQNILQIVRNAEGYWVSECLKKIKSEQDFTLNLLYYFNDNVNLTYDLTSLGNEQYTEGESVEGENIEEEIIEEEIIEEQVLEVKGVLVKLYLDKYETQYLVVKINNVDTHFMAYNEFDNYDAYFKENKLKVNDKVSIKYSELTLFDDDKNDYVAEKRILNIEKK